MSEQTGGGNNETTILATFKDKTEDGIKKLTARLAETRAEAARLNAEMNNVSTQAGKTTAGIDKVGKGQGGASGGGIATAAVGAGAMAANFSKSAEALGKVAKIVAAVAVYAQLIEVAYHAWNLRSAELAGNHEKSLEHMKALEAIVRRIPLAGELFLNVGDRINAKLTGQKLTQAEILEIIKKQTEAIEAQTAKMAKRAETQKANMAIGDPLLERFRFQGSEPEQRARELQKQIDEMDKLSRKPPYIDVRGNQTAAGDSLAVSIQNARAQLEQANRDFEQLKNDVEGQITAQRLRNAGKDREAERLEFQRELQRQQDEMRKSNNPAVRAEIDDKLVREKLFGFDRAQATRMAADAQSKFNEQLAQTAHLAESGSISIFEAQRRNVEAQKEYELAIAKTREELVALRNVATDPAVVKSIQKQIDALPEATNTLRAQINKLGFEVRDSLQLPMQGFFKGIITGSMSAKQAFKNMIAGFADNLASLAANKLATAVLGGGTDASAGGGIVGAIAGAFTKKNAGGWIPGSGPDRDSVHAMLTPGEFVVSRRAAQAYPQLLEAINSGGVNGRMLAMGSIGVPHYNVGGFVQPTSGAVGGGGGGDGVRILPAFIMTPAEGRKMVNASKDAIFELLARHPERVPRGG